MQHQVIITVTTNDALSDSADFAIEFNPPLTLGVDAPPTTIEIVAAMMIQAVEQNIKSMVPKFRKVGASDVIN